MVRLCYSWLARRFTASCSHTQDAQRMVWCRRMGTHPSGPAMLAAASDICLQDWLESHPEALGPAVCSRFGVKLPFLFKVRVLENLLRSQCCCLSSCHLAYTPTQYSNALLLQVLSVETALSIQSHPDKELAQRLHAERPEVQLLNYTPRQSGSIIRSKSCCLLALQPAVLANMFLRASTICQYIFCPTDLQGQQSQA